MRRTGSAGRGWITCFNSATALIAVDAQMQARVSTEWAELQFGHGVDRRGCAVRRMQTLGLPAVLQFGHGVDRRGCTWQPGFTRTVAIELQFGHGVDRRGCLRGDAERVVHPVA